MGATKLYKTIKIKKTNFGFNLLSHLNLEEGYIIIIFATLRIIVDHYQVARSYDVCDISRYAQCIFQ